MNDLPVYLDIAFHDDQYARLQRQFNLYEDLIVAVDYRDIEDGQPPTSFVVDPDDLATRLGQLDRSSPILPQGCLFWHMVNGQEYLAVWVPPKVWQVRVNVGSKDEAYTIPMPGLVFAGRGKRYQLYAVKGKGFPDRDTTLYRPPVPNVSNGVCAGNVPFPVASTKTIWQAVELFFDSYFNDHLDNAKSKRFPHGILAMWALLDQAKGKTYPQSDLEVAGMLLSDLARVTL